MRDLDIWNLCSNEAVLTAHVVVSDQSIGHAQTLLEEIERSPSKRGLIIPLSSWRAGGGAPLLDRA